MNIDLPSVLQRYFQAQNAHDIEALVACFSPDAAVRDEGRDIIGADAIRAWKVETSAKYRITIEPLESRSEADKIIVIAKASGTFPGSPGLACLKPAALRRSAPTLPSRINGRQDCRRQASHLTDIALSRRKSANSESCALAPDTSFNKI